MVDPVNELRAAAARLKLEVDELMGKIEALSPSDVDPLRRDESLTKEQMLVIAQRAIDRYETQSPRPVHVTITQAAAMLGLSRPTVRKMLETGALRFNGCGRIPIEQIDMVLARTNRR